MSLAQSILNLIFSFIGVVIDIILYPINTLINTYIPNLSMALDSIASMLDVAIPYVGYIVDLSLLPSFVIVLLVSYTIFKVTLPLIVYVAKTAVSWYDTLKF